MPSTSILDTGGRSATTGSMYCGIPGIVCNAIAVETVSMAALGDAVALQEVTGDVAAVRLEAPIAAGVLRREAHVVEHSTEGVRDQSVRPLRRRSRHLGPLQGEHHSWIICRQISKAQRS